MCGIVGLHLRDPALYPRLGELLTGMLCEMSERGADSAGVAVYGDPVWSPPGHATVTVLASSVPAIDGATVIDLGEVQIVHAPVPVGELLAKVAGLPIAGFGEELTVLKGVGHPRDLAAAVRLDQAQGWQGVGHTRMATESAVTPSGAHPYAVGPDQCLVHNGSFANHATIRRHLKARGVVFDSENDTEVGARYVARALADGRDIESALRSLCAEFDGFYTLLVSNRDSFAVVRDAIACKPAVIAETGAWVAMASEYRALVGLPGIEQARIFEPEPERIYAWTR
jgi:glutamate synthase domain-containing protein 1